MYVNYIKKKIPQIHVLLDDNIIFRWDNQK